MDAVWELSQATVHQVRERLNSVKPMAYNTVLTMMRILRDKGFLESRRDGRADIYRPIVSREAMGKRSVSDVLARFFAGSASALVSHLLDTEKISPEELRAIRREMDARLTPPFSSAKNRQCRKGGGKDEECA